MNTETIDSIIAQISATCTEEQAIAIQDQIEALARVAAARACMNREPTPERVHRFDTALHLVRVMTDC